LAAKALREAAPVDASSGRQQLAVTFPNSVVLDIVTFSDLRPRHVFAPDASNVDHRRHRLALSTG